MTLLDLFRFLVEGKALLDYVLIEDYSAFLAGHCSDKFGPFFFCQAFVASKTSPLADVTNVPFCVILGGRSPAGNDVANTVQFVLRGIGAEQNKSGSKAPFDGPKLDEGIVRLLVALTFPMSTCNPPDIKRVAVF